MKVFLVYFPFLLLIGGPAIVLIALSIANGRDFSWLCKTIAASEGAVFDLHSVSDIDDANFNVYERQLWRRIRRGEFLLHNDRGLAEASRRFNRRVTAFNVIGALYLLGIAALLNHYVF